MLQVVSLKRIVLLPRLFRLQIPSPASNNETI